MVYFQWGVYTPWKRWDVSLFNYFEVNPVYHNFLIEFIRPCVIKNQLCGTIVDTLSSLSQNLAKQSINKHSLYVLSENTTIMRWNPCPRGVRNLIRKQDILVKPVVNIWTRQGFRGWTHTQITSYSDFIQTFGMSHPSSQKWLRLKEEEIYSFIFHPVLKWVTDPIPFMSRVLCHRYTHWAQSSFFPWKERKGSQIKYDASSPLQRCSLCSS